jgi:hypothetical protein
LRKRQFFGQKLAKIVIITSTPARYFFSAGNDWPRQLFSPSPPFAAETVSTHGPSCGCSHINIKTMQCGKTIEILRSTLEATCLKKGRIFFQLISTVPIS